jgi:hypothetical protein
MRRGRDRLALPRPLNGPCAKVEGGEMLVPLKVPHAIMPRTPDELPTGNPN